VVVMANLFKTELSVVADFFCWRLGPDVNGDDNHHLSGRTLPSVASFPGLTMPAVVLEPKLLNWPELNP
jgi:hypothetical protein